MFIVGLISGIISSLAAAVIFLASTDGIRGLRLTRRFSKLEEQWLYDEVDLLNDHRGPFVHRILLSTGITLEIPFVSVIIHRFTVPAVTKLAKQMA